MEKKSKTLCYRIVHACQPRSTWRRWIGFLSAQSNRTRFLLKFIFIELDDVLFRCSYSFFYVFRSLPLHSVSCNGATPLISYSTLSPLVRSYILRIANVDVSREIRMKVNIEER